MRPRVFPAEDDEQGYIHSTFTAAASMRPRVFPAEDQQRHEEKAHSPKGFNEAAGIPRGRPTQRLLNVVSAICTLQ